MPLPATDLRSNVGTWAVSSFQLPALTCQMLDVLSPEKFDPDERFTLHPMEGEEVVKKLLDPDQDEPTEDGDDQDG